MEPVLLNALLEIFRAWTPAFAQTRSGKRAVEQALGSLLAMGRRTLSRTLWALGRQDLDWSADYKLHSRANSKAQDLFQPVLEQGARWCDDSVLVVAMDDTRIRKTGRKILTAFYQRDPLSPKFRVNLMWGLRFLHFSLLVPLYRSGAAVPPRSLPVRFLEVPAVRKPGKKASPAEIEAHRQLVKQQNLSRRAVDLLQELRQSADSAGLSQRTILAVGDSGFCNRTLLRWRASRRRGSWVGSKIEKWLKLEINRDKTRVVDLGKAKASLDFLGYTFRWHRDRYAREQRYLHVGPSNKSLQREWDRISELTDRRQGCTPITRLIERLNRQLEGWANYFSLGYPRDAYRGINWHLGYRLANHLKHHRSQRPYQLPEGNDVLRASPAAWSGVPEH
jgi:hypothetical protein